MRNNRRRHSHLRTANTRCIGFFAVLVLVLAGGAIVNLSLRSSVSAISRDIKQFEHEQEVLNADIQRERTCWAAMITPERLEIALRNHGLHMENPRGERIVSIQLRGGADRSATPPREYTASR